MVRFDRPCRYVYRAVNYFSMHMARKDYLTEGDRVEMTWHGRGADRLGLKGTVDEHDFTRVCKGRHPVTNEKLMQRDNGENRRVCYFGQISAPKDASIAYLVGGDQRIAGWWQESVEETLKEIEDITATRVRLGGASHDDRPTGNMAAAVVTHDTSRALDPQLHTHVCVMNVTYDAKEQRWKAVQPQGFYKYQSYLREVSYNKLAEKMKEGGYEIEKARSIGFNIKGFPADLREDFSKRREEIERVADVLKSHSQDALQLITTQTRAEKVHVEPEELKARWLGEAAAHLSGIKQIIDEAQPGEPAKIFTPAQALTLAEAHLFDRQSVVDERFLLREALIAGRGDVTLDQLKAEVAARVQSGDLIKNGKMVTTPEILRMEQAIIDWTNGGKGICPAMGKFEPHDALSPEQNQTAEKLLASPDRVAVLIGDAGAGKSTTLPVIVQGIHETGNLTFACAPSANAAQELQDKLKIQTDTVQQLLVNEKLQNQIIGRTIIIDEAGLLSVRQMYDLCQIGERQQCRLLLVGDVKQHHSVEAGDALRALQKYAQIEPARLQEIHRQQDDEYKKVVKFLADGHAYSSFRKLDELGGVSEQKDFNKLLDQAAATYIDKVAQGQSCLAISPVWSEVNAFTAVLREQLKDKGLLDQDEKTYKAVQSMQWTPAGKMQLSNYQVGDALTFHRNSGGFQKHEMVSVVSKDAQGLTLERPEGSRSFFDPQKHKGFDVGLPRTMAVAPGEKLLVRANFAPGRLKNGDIVTVKEVKEDGSLALQDGRTIPAHFRQFTHGYASTSHSAQSKTVDHGILVLGEKGYQAANLQQAYVSNSRFTHTQTIFTTDKERAFDSMAKFEERPLALEAIKSAASEPPKYQEKEGTPIQMPEKIDSPVKLKSAESLDWNPVSSKIGI
jgi:conjugative relaxase-like TrwC/TraI family protein